LKVETRHRQARNAAQTPSPFQLSTLNYRL
jgi:hypothetical protein